jgi:hypothetical protein
MQDSVELLVNKKKHVKVNGLNYTLELIKQNLFQYLY